MATSMHNVYMIDIAFFGWTFTNLTREHCKRLLMMRKGTAKLAGQSNFKTLAFIC